MKCSKCGIKTAHIAVIDKDGNFYDDNVFCCFCFAKDMNEKLNEAEKSRKAREN